MSEQCKHEWAGSQWERAVCIECGMLQSDYQRHRITELQAEVERLRELNGDWEYKHIVLRHELEAAERKLERLVGDLEVALKRQSGDHPFRSEVEAALKEVRDE